MQISHFDSSKVFKHGVFLEQKSLHTVVKSIWPFDLITVNQHPILEAL